MGMITEVKVVECKDMSLWDLVQILEQWDDDLIANGTIVMTKEYQYEGE
jgi:hypothetical protein